MVSCSYIVEHRGSLHIIKVADNVVSDRRRGVEYGVVIGGPGGDYAFIRFMDVELRMGNDALIDMLLDTFSYVLRRGKLIEARCDG